MLRREVPLLLRKREACCAERYRSSLGVWEEACCAERCPSLLAPVRVNVVIPLPALPLLFPFHCWLIVVVLVQQCFLWRVSRLFWLFPVSLLDSYSRFAVGQCPAAPLSRFTVGQFSTSLRPVPHNVEHS